MIADPRLREDDEFGREDDEFGRQDDEKYRGVLGAGPLGVGVAEYTTRWRVEPAMTTWMQRGGFFPLFNMDYSLSFLEWQAHSPPSQGQW